MNRAGTALAVAIFAAGIELSWMSGLLQLAESRVGLTGIPAAWLLGGLPFAFALRRLTRRLRPRVRVAAFTAGGLLWAAVSFPFLLAGLGGGAFPGTGPANAGRGAALAATAALGAWGAGLRLAGLRPSPGGMLVEFQFGVLVLLGVLLLAAPGTEPLPGAAGAVVSLFLCFFLGAAALRARSVGLSLRRAVFSPWGVAAGVGVAGILAAAALLAAAVTPGWVQAALETAERAWMLAAEGFRALIAWLDGLLPRPAASPLPAVVGGPPAERTAPAVIELLRLPEALRRVAAFLVVAFWLALFALCLWRMAAAVAHRLLGGAWAGPEEKTERLPGSFGEGLRRMLGRAWRLLGRGIRGLAAFFGRRLPLGGPPAPEELVRRVYRDLLARAAACGMPREPSQTPREFLAHLRRRAPEGLGSAFARITALYEAVCYAETPLGEEAARRLACEWRLVRKFRLAAEGRAGPPTERRGAEGEGRR